MNVLSRQITLPRKFLIFCLLEYVQIWRLQNCDAITLDPFNEEFQNCARVDFQNYYNFVAVICFCVVKQHGSRAVVAICIFFTVIPGFAKVSLLNTTLIIHLSYPYRTPTTILPVCPSVFTHVTTRKL